MANLPTAYFIFLRYHFLFDFLFILYRWMTTSARYSFSLGQRKPPPPKPSIVHPGSPDAVAMKCEPVLWQSWPPFPVLWGSCQQEVRREEGEGRRRGGAEGDLDDGKEATAYDEVRKLGWWRERWSQGGLMKSKVGALRWDEGACMWERKRWEEGKRREKEVN